MYSLVWFRIEKTKYSKQTTTTTERSNQGSSRKVERSLLFQIQLVSSDSAQPGPSCTVIDTKILQGTTAAWNTLHHSAVNPTQIRIEIRKNICDSNCRLIKK